MRVESPETRAIRLNYEASADQLAHLRRFVMGSEVGHGFIDSGHKIVHTIPKPPGEELEEGEIIDGEASAYDGVIEGIYIGPLNKVQVADLYAERYVIHDSLRRARQ